MLSHSLASVPPKWKEKKEKKHTTDFILSLNGEGFHFMFPPVKFEWTTLNVFFKHFVWLLEIEFEAKNKNEENNSKKEA